MEHRPRASALGLSLLALLVVGGQADDLFQTYCSTQNTGSSYSVDVNIYQSNGLCHDICLANYAFAVVQYQSCWCTNYIPSSQVDVSECDQECPGYPSESCGNADTGLFGYIALNLAASGTVGVSSSSTATSTRTTQSRSASTSSVTTASSSPSSSSTSLIPATTSTAEASSSPLIGGLTSSMSSITSSSALSSTMTSDVLLRSTASTLSTSSATTTTQSSTTSTAESETPVTNTQVVTVSGAVVTQTVTSTPKPRSSATAVGTTQDSTQSGTSTGVIVGAVVGSLAGVALILLGLFLLWRRRRQAGKPDASSGGMTRNASVLSKAGLLATGGTRDAEKSMEEPRYGSQRQSALYETPESPVSAMGGAFENSSQASRRNSRPLVYDQRLNPAAIMQDWQLNGSRASIGTLQDQRDYSRPLGVTNPDIDRD